MDIEELEELAGQREIIGLFWDKETGAFLGAYIEGVQDPVRKWDTGHWIPATDPKMIQELIKYDYVQHEHIEIYHKVKGGKSPCCIHINCKAVKWC